jgi:hypothetical protein
MKFVCWISVVAVAAAANTARPLHPNVLYVVVDDLRPELPVYGTLTSSMQSLLTLSVVLKAPSVWYVDPLDAKPCSL